MLGERNFRAWTIAIAVAFVLVIGALITLLRTTHRDIATSIPADPTITSSVVNKSSLTPATMTNSPRGNVPAGQGRP
jgi:hypothetical protein